jgi:hypothetical protein
MDSMWGTSDRPLLTLAQVRAWEARIQEIAAAVQALRDEEAQLSRKLEAVHVLVDDLSAVDVCHIEIAPQQPIQTATERPANEEEDTRKRGAFPDAVIMAISTIGGAPLPKTIRAWLRENGATAFIRGKADTQYFYTSLMRHAENGRLIKVGDGYRLPTSSAQAETGVGDPGSL